MRLRDADMFSDDVFKFAIEVSKRDCRAPKLARWPFTAARAESMIFSALVEPSTVETSIVLTDFNADALVAKVATNVEVPSSENPLSEVNSTVPRDTPVPPLGMS